MTILQYPEYAYFHMLSESSAELGTYSIPAITGDLSLAHLRVIHKNIDQFEYKLRLSLQTYITRPAFLTSEWETFSNESIGQTSEYWMGDLTFTFKDYFIKAPEFFSIKIETIGYTRNSDSKYLGVLADWNFGDATIVPVGTVSTGGAGIALGIKV